MLKLKLKIMRLLLLLVLLSNFLIPADSSAGSLFSKLDSTQIDYWLKLLHYHNGKGRPDGENFYLAPKGKTDPEAEMQATINSFSEPNAESGWFKYHPQCVFRERLNFLKKAGLLNNLVEKDCPEFAEWKKGLNAESITLVFSTSYPNNPSSLFGHTLIRLNQKNKTNDLLDYSVAFSAIPEHDDMGLVFAFKGMFGGYKGLLEVTKYYTKVNEYNNGESRDLIEYEINITPDELDRLINHLWEIYQTTYFDYFFSDENCSAVLADILAVPFNQDRVNTHERWYYLPSEMIKTFKKIPGRIKSESFRASLKKQLEKNLNKLSLVQTLELRELARERNLPHNYNNIPVLDSLIGLLNFTRYRTKDNLSEDEQVLMRKALLRRSALAQDTNAAIEVYDQNNRPDLGHDPQKFSLFLRTEKAHSLVGIEFKEGYHDLMSNDLGFDPFSQFDFFTASLVYDKNLNRVSYDSLTFVNLTSLHTYKFYDPQFSWSAKVVADRINELDCELCHRLNARAYLGPTIRPTPKMAATLMTGVFGEASSHLEQGFRVGIGFEGSFFLQVTNAIKIGLVDELRFSASDKIQKDYYNTTSFRQSYFPTINTEWRFESSLVSKYRSFDSNKWINQLNYGFFF